MKVSEYHRPTCSDIHLRVALQFIPKWPKILRQTSRSPTEVYHMHIPRFFFFVQRTESYIETSIQAKNYALWCVIYMCAVTSSSIHSFWAAWTLKKVLRSFETREPFTGQNAIYQKIPIPRTPHSQPPHRSVNTHTHTHTNRKPWANW